MFYQVTITWLVQSSVQGVLSAIIVIYAYSQAVKLCGVERASMLSVLIPITSLLTNFILSGEGPGARVLAALAVIMIGFVTATRQARHMGAKSGIGSKISP